MIRTATAICLLTSILVPWAAAQNRPLVPSYDYDVAQAHEIKPHRRTVPMEGVDPGFNQLHLTLTVSPVGEVLHAEATGETNALKFWSQLESEVLQWRFTPFEQNGKAVTAEVEEYLDLVPPERSPKKHLNPPVLKPSSQVSIALHRSGCLGTCPSYTVTVSTSGIAFDGQGYVVASGRHTDTANADEVRNLAYRFVAADFYSMDSNYTASVTDMPVYLISIEIDGHRKEVTDYVGRWVGMPAVISDLENEVDEFAHTSRWIEGSDGLVQALQAEKYGLKTFDAQILMKEAASRGMINTVKELLAAGVPLTPKRVPRPKDESWSPFEDVGWLTAASSHPEVLQVLIDSGASRFDQRDKDLALAGAARSGKLESARALIAYGANPNADLSKVTVTETSGGMTLGEEGAGSVLIYAAESGNPAMIREILPYNPHLDKRDRTGKTALFAATDYRDGDQDGARVECVRLLVQAGADVNARDNDGNTPLHETFLTDVEQELLKLGADVNARNNEGETPIFTTVDDEAIPLFIAHGADLTIRNNDGKTVFEAAKERGPRRQEVLRKATEEKSTDQP